MKVLITGMTSRQIGQWNAWRPESWGRGGEPKVYCSCPHIFARTVSSLGHDVEQRPVIPGEDLGSYDRVFVWIGSITDPPMVYAFSCLWALAERPDAVLMLADWKISNVAASFRQIARDAYYYLWDSPFAKARAYYNEAQKVRRRIERLAVEMGVPRGEAWTQQLVVPLHPWGKVEGMRGCPPAELTTGLDYTPGLLYPRGLKPARTKARRWIHASLGDRSKWLAKQAFAWPVEEYGYKAKRITEAEVFARYAVSWGVIAARYPQSAWGWWRPRFAHAAHYGNVVYCDREDAIVAASPAHYLELDDVERLRPKVLKEVAAQQAKFMQRESWTSQKLKAEVKRLVEGVPPVRTVNVARNRRLNVATRKTIRRDKKAAPKPTQLTHAAKWFRHFYLGGLVRPTHSVLDLSGSTDFGDSLAHRLGHVPRHYATKPEKGKQYDMVWCGEKRPDAKVAKQLAAGGVVGVLGKPNATFRGFTVVNTWGTTSSPETLSAALEAPERRLLRQLAHYYGPHAAAWIVAPVVVEASDTVLYVLRREGDEGKTTAELVPATKPTRKKKPRTKKAKKRTPPAVRPVQGIGAFIRERLLAGTDRAQVLKEVHAKFKGKTKATMSDIHWNARKLRTQGHKV